MWNQHELEKVPDKQLGLLFSEKVLLEDHRAASKLFRENLEHQERKQLELHQKLRSRVELSRNQLEKRHIEVEKLENKSGIKKIRVQTPDVKRVHQTYGFSLISDCPDKFQKLSRPSTRAKSPQCFEFKDYRGYLCTDYYDTMERLQKSTKSKMSQRINFSSSSARYSAKTTKNEYL